MRNGVSLNLNVRGMGQSATIAIKDCCRQLLRQERVVYDFGLGQSPFPVPAPIVEALRGAAHEKDYLPAKGLPALREAVADFHRRTDRVSIDPEHVLIGPGSKELMFLLQLVYYGEIVVRTPCWVSYVPQARILGRRLSFVHTSPETGWKLTAGQLAHALEITNDATRPRLLVLNYPDNPTGHGYTSEELSELAEVARRFELIVLSDEIYGQLHYDGEHASIARFCPERTIISSGLSKWCGAGGWRLGTFAFPRELDWLVDVMAAVASETYTSVSAPIQHAAVVAFRGGEELDEYLGHVRRVLRALAGRLVHTLREAGLRVNSPDGAFYLFLDFSPFAERLAARGVTQGAALCKALLDETGVAILPGVAFGRSRQELTARLAFVDFDGAAALAASQQTPLESDLPPQVIDRCCGQVLRGAEQIAEWLARL